MRFWYQSFVDPRSSKPYFDRLRGFLDEVTHPGTEVEIGGVWPPDGALHRISELRCSIQAIDHAFHAQEQGFDVFVLGHFQDAGLYEARACVDIPVVGMGEASMLWAGQLGRRFGLVTIDEVFIPIHREQAERYGVVERLAGIATMQTPVDELLAAFTSDWAYEQVRASFERGAQEVVDAGAEVVIPAGGLFGMLSARERDFRVGDAVVLNPVAVSAIVGEAAARLHGITGLGPSRAGVFASPTARAVEEFRTAARGAREATPGGPATPAG